MIYLHYYETESEYAEGRSTDYEEPWTSFTEETERVHYNKTREEKLLGTPLTIQALGSGTFSWSTIGSRTNIQYSKNGGERTTLYSGTTISLVDGDELQFFCSVSATTYCGATMSCTADFNLKGNIMSLLYGDSFADKETLPPNTWEFQKLFANNTTLISAGDLKLPSKNLEDQCYSNMFSGCTSLEVAPELPATGLAYSCYGGMFHGCTSLKNAPILPATTLANRCYESMFYECTSLESAPELPATAATENCYSYMFYWCTSLESAPVLPILNLAKSSYAAMFRGCTNLKYVKAMFITTITSPSYSVSLNQWMNGVSATGKFVKNSQAQWNITGVSGIPDGWEVELVSE